MKDRPTKCRACGSEDLYGPVSDYWGCCCADCGHEMYDDVGNFIPDPDYDPPDCNPAPGG